MNIKLLPLLAALGCTVLFYQAKAAEIEKGYHSLFDGRSLKGWTYLGKPGGEYHVSHGVIVCPETTMGNLVTDAEYGDFSLRLEYKFEKDGNNGVAIRAPLSKENLTYVGVEIQMLDDTAPKHRNLKAWQYNGSVYGIAAATNGTARIGEWNTEEIECIGRNYRIILNGREIVHANLNDVANVETLQAHPGMFRLRGHLGFLGHDSHFEFRNIRIKDLTKPAPFNEPPDGFHPLFEAIDLAGNQTSPDLESPKAKENSGREILLNGRGDLIKTRGTFKNFELLMDWKAESKGSANIILRHATLLTIDCDFGYARTLTDEEYAMIKRIKNEPANTAEKVKEGKNSGQEPLPFSFRHRGYWSHCRIVALGNRVHVFVDGQLMENNLRLENGKNGELPADPGGPIELLCMAGKVRFKNIFLREIK